MSARAKSTKWIANATDAAVKMAAVIASNNPIAVVSTKHLMNRECGLSCRVWSDRADVSDARDHS